MLETTYVLGVSLLAAWSVHRMVLLTAERDSARRQAAFAEHQLEQLRCERDQAHQMRDEAWRRASYETVMRHRAEAQLQTALDNAPTEQTVTGPALRSRR
jgi:Tfp pilus assembly protein PilV